MSDVRVVLADEVQLIDWGESRTLGPWVKLRLSGSDSLAALRGLDTATGRRTGHVFDLLLAEPAGGQPVRHGAAAESLRLSGFCRRQEVWRALGTDAEFLEWIRTQPCAAPGMGARSPCSGDVVAAHVRRIADGAGTGIKPEYSAIPLCDAHHRAQHQHGESRIAPREVWEDVRMRTVESWAWDRLRSVMGVSSMADADPADVRRWAESHGLTLPDEYPY
jgi:hypothetical protein